MCCVLLTSREHTINPSEPHRNVLRKGYGTLEIKAAINFRQRKRAALHTKGNQVISDLSPTTSDAGGEQRGWPRLLYSGKSSLTHEGKRKLVLNI